MPMRLGTKTVNIPFSKAYLGDVLKYQKEVIKDILSYYGTATALTYKSHRVQGVSIGNYALFAGGMNGSMVRSNADAYDLNLVKTKAPNLASARREHSGAKVGNYALFAGGYNASEAQSSVDVYDAQLVKHTAINLTSTLYEGAGSSIGDYAIFAVGYNKKTVNAVDRNLVVSTIEDLFVERQNLGATTIGNYAIFAGGDYRFSTFYSTVDVYDKNLVKITSPTPLTKAKTWLHTACASNKDYALVGPGMTSSSACTNVVDAYNKDLVKTLPTQTQEAKRMIFAGGLGNYIIMGGGNTIDVATNISEAYNKNLIKTTIDSLSTKRSISGVANVGDYLLFAGGFGTSSTAYDTVDAYQIT